MKFYAKVYREGKDILVACCDRNIRGKTFEEGELVLQVTESFYCGELLEGPELCSLLEKATVANMVGKGVVELAVGAGLVDENNVLWVRGIPHTQLVRM
ncbi:MAG: DUF424 family protein [Candidatus Hydrothermarchaeaceae archaeon]